MLVAATAHGRFGMKKVTETRRFIHGVLAAGIVVGSALLLGGAVAAPTTQGLVLQTESHCGLALAGNGNESYVFVSVYNEAGPVRGIASGSLSVSVIAVPPGAPPIKKTAFTETVGGIYKIALSPELSSQRWTAGKYVVAVALTSQNGSGVAVASLVIDE
jgi:hypothetical protein